MTEPDNGYPKTPMVYAIHNSYTDRKLWLFIEPIGNDYFIPLGETYELRIEAMLTVPFRVKIRDGTYITLYSNGDEEVFHNNERVDF